MAEFTDINRVVNEMTANIEILKRRNDAIVQENLALKVRVNDLTDENKRLRDFCNGLRQAIIDGVTV